MHAFIYHYRNIHNYMRMHLHKFIHACIHASTHKYIYPCMHTYTNTYMHTHMHAYNMHTTCIQAQKHRYNTYIDTYIDTIFIYTSVCMCVSSFFFSRPVNKRKSSGDIVKTWVFQFSKLIISQTKQIFSKTKCIRIYLITL